MGLKTYIVEDNATIRDNLIATLEELVGIDAVGTAETENEAKDWLRTDGQSWDLAIVDLFLKQGSGLGVLEACRDRPYFSDSALSEVRRFLENPVAWSAARGGVASQEEAMARKGLKVE